MDQKNSKVLKTLKYWLPFAAAITLVAGMVYLAVQQNYRQNANDPQIQISEDVVTALDKGAPPEYIVPQNNSIEMSVSLSPFLIIYNASGTPVASSVTLDGKNPELPADVLKFVKSKTQNRLTWQPKSGIRIAAVITKRTDKAGGAVLAGRSLREVEKREQLLAIQVGAAWTASLLAMLMLAAILNYKKEIEKEVEKEINPDTFRGE